MFQRCKKTEKALVRGQRVVTAKAKSQKWAKGRTCISALLPALQRGLLVDGVLDIACVGVIAGGVSAWRGSSPKKGGNIVETSQREGAVELVAAAGSGALGQQLVQTITVCSPVAGDAAHQGGAGMEEPSFEALMQAGFIFVLGVAIILSNLLIIATYLNYRGKPFTEIRK